MKIIPAIINPKDKVCKPREKVINKLMVVPEMMAKAVIIPKRSIVERLVN